MERRTLARDWRSESEQGFQTNLLATHLVTLVRRFDEDTFWLVVFFVKIHYTKEKRCLSIESRTLIDKP
ncbi:hypothetical protein GCM10007968_22880 [Sporolactobacillus putidus]|uniref:Uncharacterized protein n=1 Tax=Sporolactobacillus putidus TaxID=492735 RepID=A0A917W1L6_9BACL|nr:hypothetical protein GCM10007968_22880 [Sporolactobacillus putidus]